MISRRQFLRGRFSAPAVSTPNPAIPQWAVIGPACIAYAQNVVCRSCGDACGEAAIRFSPRAGETALPLVQNERCTGCGECQPVCPAGAITLVPAVQSLKP